MAKTKGTKKLMAAFAVSLAAAAFLVGAVAFSTSDVFTPAQFQPIQTTRVAFDVYTIDGTLLGSIVVGETESAKFSQYDPSSTISKYPRLGVFRSNAPYASDAAGNYLTSPSIVTTTKRVLGDTVTFWHKTFFSYDMGARTYTALPASRTDTYRQVTPVAGQDIDGGCIIRPTLDSLNRAWFDDTNKIAYVPRGTMLCTIDKGWSPWRINEIAGAARISKSLEPIDYEGERAGAAQAGLTFADALNRLRTNYGNTPVTVRPRVTIRAVNNFERYEYEQTAELSNGTTVTMTLNTTSALVGFERAYVAKWPWAGLIPKQYAEQFDRAGFDYSDSDASKENTPDSELSETQGERTARFWYSGDYSIPGGNELTRIITPVDAWSSIDSITPVIDWNMIQSGRNSLPTSVDLQAEIDLQPATTVKIANMRATGMVKSTNWGTDTYYGYDVSYQYPYALTIDNVAAMYTFTLEVDLFTNNEVVMLTSSGLPVDISKLVDFDLGSVIGNPTADNMKFTVETVSIWDRLFGMFTGVFGQIIQVLAYVAVIVVIGGVAYIIMQIKRGKA